MPNTKTTPPTHRTRALADLWYIAREHLAVAGSILGLLVFYALIFAALDWSNTTPFWSM